MKEIISIEFSANEINEILDGLLEQGYKWGKIADKEDDKITDAQIDENDIAEAIATTRRKRAEAKKAAAYRAYDKIKKEAMRLGLIF